MIIVDTSVLIESFGAEKILLPTVRRALDRGVRLLVPALVLYEWWRGPRTEPELAIQQELLPREAAIVFSAREAAIAARLYGQLSRPRTREIDIAIAACAISQEAALWTLNTVDFKDIPGLTLANPD